MKELSKEQLAEIEFEANRYANDFSETSSQHPFLKRGYIAAASKYLLQNMEDKKALQSALKVEMETMQAAIDRASNIMDEKDSRIKDLEDGLRSLTDFSNTWGQEWFNKETWDIIEKAKQLLNPK